MKRICKVICICMSSVLLLNGCGIGKNASTNDGEKAVSEEPKEINGEWTAILEDGTDIALVISSSNEEIYLNSEAEKCEGYPLGGVDFSDGKLCFLIPRKTDNLRFSLELVDEEHLSGTYEFYDESWDVTFERKQKNCMIKDCQTAEFDHSYEELKEMMKEYSQYGKDDMEYTFHYDLNNRDGCEAVIEKYQLDEVTAGKTDVELMEAVLNWECELLDHSSSNIADDRELGSLIQEGVKNGVNCRGLSLILSQVLRMYGVKAQIVCCMPYEDLSMDCHVVVQAYSEELGQWIMLDPTYCMMIKDSNGNYVNVKTLRENIMNNVSMTCNESAGYNGETMTAEDFQFYLEYMAKNSCYYGKFVENYNGSDNEDNIYVLLVSENYEEAHDELKSTGKIITVDSEHFWK